MDGITMSRGREIVSSQYDLQGFKQHDLNNFSGGTAEIYVSQYATFDQVSQEFRLLTQLDSPLNAMLGLYYADSKFTFDTAALVAPLPLDPASGRYDTFQRDNGFDGKTLSAFTELTYAITPELEFAGDEAEFSGYIGACYAGQTVAEGCDLDPGASGAFNSQDFDGRTAPKAPKWSGRLGASYSMPVGNDLIAALTTDAAYTDDYNFTDALRPDGVQDAFTRIDASISIGREDGRWQVSLIGRNLSDELVVTSAYDMPSQVSAASAGTGTNTGRRSDMNAIVERPRQIHLQLTTRF